MESSESTITEALRSEFHDRGLIRLDGLLPLDVVEKARAPLIASMARQGVWEHGIWQLAHLAPSTAANAGVGLVKGMKRVRAFKEIITPVVVASVSDLLDGQPLTTLVECPQLLFTLPNASRWTIPHTIWHLDMPRLPSGGLPGVQLFAFLDTVPVCGGGTLVVTGSHRLLNHGKFITSKRVKRSLKREPWFTKLLSAGENERDEVLGRPGQVRGVEVQLAELHGSPGDVYLMDMRLLHTVAPNASSKPRIMLTQRFLPQAVKEELYGVYGAEPPEVGSG